MRALIADMFDTMHAANGAGLAAPQIGVNLQLVIYGFKQNLRYPDAPQVPETVLINPVLTPLSERKEEGFEGCLSVPGLRGSVPRWSELRYEGVDQFGQPISRDATASMRAWCSMKWTTCWHCIPCVSLILRNSVTRK
jgi:peptide deformylase